MLAFALRCQMTSTCLLDYQDEGKSRRQAGRLQYTDGRYLEKYSQVCCRAQTSPRPLVRAEIQSTDTKVGKPVYHTSKKRGFLSLPLSLHAQKKESLVSYTNQPANQPASFLPRSELEPTTVPTYLT